MDKYHSTSGNHSNNEHKKTEDLYISAIHNGLICINYPYNVELTANFFQQQDKYIQNKYHRLHRKQPQLLIQLDGISELDASCKPYIQSNQHQKLYDSIAFVLSKGNMAVLERHYLELLLANQLQNKRLKEHNHYSVGIFTDRRSAQNWLASRPGSHYRH